MACARLLIAQTLANAETANEAACFIYDTYVQMQCGHVEIQFISPGDKVLSRCESTGEIAYRKVAKTFTHEKKQIYGLRYSTLDGREFGEGTTGQHPFWVKDVGWTEVRNLQPGNVIETYDNNTVKITSVKKTDHFATVYNLEVEEFHTYFVGSMGLWVHNKCIDRGRA